MAMNYLEATQEEMNEHVANVSSAVISMARKHHLTKGSAEVVAKIDKARKVLKFAKAKALMDQEDE